MDYEKKYKEALEWARKVMQGKVGFVLDEVLEKFPELKESEDERILRCLKEIVDWGCAKNISVECGVSLKNVKSWLEKNGEQKPAWKPSDEQLEALEYSLSDYNTIIFEERHDTLTSLYQDLKKLKEE